MNGMQFGILSIYFYGVLAVLQQIESAIKPICAQKLSFKWYLNVTLGNDHMVHDI